MASKFVQYTWHRKKSASVILYVFVNQIQSYINLIFGSVTQVDKLDQKHQILVS